MAQAYTIRIAGGVLDDRWGEWLDGWMILPQPGGETILSGVVQDQAELHGILNRLFGLNLTLVSVCCKAWF